MPINHKVEDPGAAREYIDLLRSLNPDSVLSKRLDEIEESLGVTDGEIDRATPVKWPSAGLVRRADYGWASR